MDTVSTSAPVRLCQKMVAKAVELLKHNESSKEEVPCGAVRQTLEALLVSLHELGLGTGSDFGAIASDVLKSVCVPYLRVISEEVVTANRRQALVDLIAPLAKLAACILQQSSVELKDSILGDLILPVVSALCSHTAGHVGSKEQASDRSQTEGDFDSHVVVAFLDQVFQLVGVEELEAGTWQSLSPMSTLYTHLIGVLQRCESATCFLLASCLLPRFATASHLERVKAIWVLIESVQSGETIVECNKEDFVLTLLCCYGDVLVGHDNTSPFTSSFCSKALEQSPVLDVRVEAPFWSIVQEGLTSLDPLSRKRCVYLLRRVLKSVQESNAVDMAGQGVFWWREPHAKRLEAVWDDLVLLLETMEEKQVCHGVQIHMQLVTVLVMHPVVGGFGCEHSM